MTEKELERLYGRKNNNISNKKENKKNNSKTLYKKKNKLEKNDYEYKTSNRFLQNNKSKNNKSKDIRKKRINYKKIFFMFLAITMIILSVAYYNDCRKITIYLDPGHGGNDPGAISYDNSMYEKDDVLKLALQIQKKLNDKIKKNKLNARVKLTRRTDEYVSLQDRCKMANRRNAIMFVALHRNSTDNTDAKGVEVWINNYKNETEIELANDILNELNKTNISQNRGIKYGTTGNVEKNYYVNEHSNMKSLIIEIGFISNEYDNLLFETHEIEYAEAISNGIMENLLKTINIDK